MSDPVGQISYGGAVRVRPYRQGTYLGSTYLEQLIEQALGDHFSFGQGWSGYGVVSIELYEQQPGTHGGDESGEGVADAA